MWKILLPAICLPALLSMSSCSWGKHSDGVYLKNLADSISGMEAVAGGELLSPFMMDGQIYYEHEGHVYSGSGRIVVEIVSPDSSGVAMPLAFTDSYSRRVTFTRTVDPGGRLLYAEEGFREEKGLYLYDPCSGELGSVVEFFSLTDRRADSESRNWSIWIPEELRTRLEKEGCFLPARDDGPDRNIRTPDDVPFTVWHVVRENLKTRRSIKAYRKELGKHIDSLMPHYEAAIVRFIESRREEAYIYTVSGDGRDRGREYVVLPGTGFAFEKTKGMAVAGLPYAGAGLPGWDRKRKDVSLRKTGVHRWVRFQVVGALIPWFSVNCAYHYNLSVDGETWAVFTFDKVKPLDCRTIDGKTCFSLADRNDNARLFIYDNPGTEKK